MSIHELDVASPSALIARLGADCGPLQFVRELEKNAAEAVEMGAGTGRIVWDLDWQRVENSDGRERKLSIVDTGCGLTHEELHYFVNHLAASGKKMSRTANFGVGAKIAAGTRNPHGLEYKSWKDGVGALVRFMRSSDDKWGLAPQVRKDGSTDYWLPLTDEDKPWLLRGLDSGTQVTLLGDSDKHDTTQAPKAVTENRQRWIVKYLNSRFLRFPAGIETLVREGSVVKPGTWKAGHLSQVHGHEYFLERRALDAGRLDLSDCRVHWWILDEDHKGRRAEGLEWQSTGHVAAVYEDELYDLLAPTRGGYTRLQSEFGVRFAYERVVLYIEPQVEDGRVEANTARTTLMLDSEPLPWNRWGEEFRENLPGPIRQLQERVAQDVTSGQREEAIRNRLRENIGLLSLSRYRAPRGPKLDLALGVGAMVADPAAGEHDSALTVETVHLTNGTATYPNAGEAGAVAVLDAPAPPADPPVDLADELDSAGETTNAESPLATAATVDTEFELEPEKQEVPVELDLPEVVWVSSKRRPPTRAIGDLEDRAARYDRDAHVLTINEDFRLYTDLVGDWVAAYQNTAGSKTVVEAVVKEWMELALVELVLTARSMEGSPAWNEEELERMLSTEGLTAAVMPRVAMTQHLKKALAQRLGKL